MKVWHPWQLKSKSWGDWHQDLSVSRKAVFMGSPKLAHILGPKSALVTKVYENAYEKDFLDYTIVKIA